MTSDITLSSTAQKAQNTANQAVTLAEDFSQFLQLLTTQLQNQDPLSPMDSTEFTNQLVQFSQVEQQINSNQKLDNLVQLQLASISTVALGYVGMDISYLSAEANFDGSTPVTINYSQSKVASQAKINIYDATGALVFSESAPNAAGRHEFVWDGKTTGGQALEPGTYTVSIDAVDAEEGKPIDIQTAVSGNVRGIETQNGVIFVLVGERAVPLSSILQARVPDAAVPETAPEGEQGDTQDV